MTAVILWSMWSLAAVRVTSPGVSISARRPVPAMRMSSPNQFDALREEAEAPFRKPRLFLYIAGAGSGAIGGAVTAAQLAAALIDHADQPRIMELVRNLAVDLVALGGCGTLIARDLRAQALRTKRLATGRQIAALRVQLQWPNDKGVVSLADLRSGRGRDSRIVITIGEQAAVSEALKAARGVSERMRGADLLVVPYCLGGREGQAALASECADDTHVAMPVLGDAWQQYVDENELSRAREQGVDLERYVLLVVVKKNGRVGQRALFPAEKPPWLVLLGDVDRRTTAGLDVRNI